MSNHYFMIDKGYEWYKEATYGMDRKTKRAFHREEVWSVLTKAGLLDKRFKDREDAVQAMLDNELSWVQFHIYEVSDGLSRFFPAPK